MHRINGEPDEAGYEQLAAAAQAEQPVDSGDKDLRESVQDLFNRLQIRKEASSSKRRLSKLFKS